MIFSNKSGDTRDYFVYAPNQWETTLQCNVVSHWLAAYTKQSLEWTQTVIYKVPFEVMATSLWCYGSLQRSPSTTQSFYFLQITAKPFNIIVINWKLKHSQNTLINLLVIGSGIKNIFQWNFSYNWKVFIWENVYESVIKFKIEILQLSMLLFIENEMYLLSDSAGINRQMQFIIGMACVQTTLLNHLHSLTHWQPDQNRWEYIPWNMHTLLCMF